MGVYTMIKWDLSQGCKDFQYLQINQNDIQLNKSKKKQKQNKQKII